MKNPQFERLALIVGTAVLLGALARIERPAATDRTVQQRSHPPTFIAHRGYSDRYPENTIGSIREAVDHGAQWVEVDVRWTRDRVPVLHHDVGLEGSLGLLRDVKEVTAAELRARPIVGSAERIPTLRQTMAALARDRAKLYLHLKDGEVSAEEARELIAICRSYGFLGRVRFNSGSFLTLARLRAEDQTVWLEFDLYDAKGLVWSNHLTRQDLLSIARLAVHSVGTFGFKIDRELVGEAHRHGLLVDALVSVQGMPFHSERADYRKMLRLDVDEIMTDDIGRYPLPAAKSRKKA